MPSATVFLLGAWALAAHAQLPGYRLPKRQGVGAPYYGSNSTSSAIESYSSPSPSSSTPSETTSTLTTSSSILTSDESPSPSSYTSATNTLTTSTSGSTYSTSNVPSLTGYNQNTSTVTTSSSGKNTSSGATCTGASLNVLSASLDWWYTETYTYGAITVSFKFDEDTEKLTGWEIIPATTAFDITQALAQPTCTPTTTYYTDLNVTAEIWSCFTTPTPIAAATSLITQSAFKSPSRTSGTGTRIPKLAVTPPPASATIDNGGAYLNGTPFVYFSAYEIMSESPTTLSNGKIGCDTVTEVYTMAEPFSFEYAGGDVNGFKEVGTNVTGDVNPAFLGVVGITSGVQAGSWVAAPTMVVVVEYSVVAEAEAAVNLTPAASLATPLPTLPSWLSPAEPTEPTTIIVGTGGRTESTQTSLDVPTNGNAGGGGGMTVNQGSSPPPALSTTKTFVGQSGSSTMTLTVPVVSTATVVTVTFSDHTVTATAIDQLPPPGSSSSGGWGAAIISAINSFGKPTDAIGALTQPVAPAPSNAAQVLSDAQNGGGAQPTGNAGGSGSSGGGGQPAANNGAGSSAAPAPTFQFGGSTITAAPVAPIVVVDGHTLTRGGPAVTDGGVVLSAPPGRNVVVVNGQTFTMPNSPGASTVFNVGGMQVTAAPAPAFALSNGQTLQAGGPAITIDGSTVSLAPGGTAVVINGETSLLSAPTAQGDSSGQGIPLLTIGSHTFTANAATQFFLAPGQTLTPGGTAVIDGTTISLGVGATQVVINGQTETLSPVTSAPANGAQVTAAPVLTIGGETFSALPGGGATYVIEGETLTPGAEETVVVDGRTYIVSLSPSATVLEIEMVNGNGQVTATSFEMLFPATVTNTNIVTPTGSSGTNVTDNTPPNNAASKSSRTGLLLCLAGLSSLLLAVWL